ncbi:MAG: sulfate transporter permease subunit CysW [Phycisphaerales bacterium]|nr:sulfate transporter permease subunit CysW [Phycisphaerales bacterium]
MSRKPLPNSGRRRFRLLPILIGLFAVTYLIVIVGLPVGAIFYNAFAEGREAFMDALRDDETQHALKLTVMVCLAVVPLNAIFGLAAAWVLARHRFMGRSALAALVNLPLALAPTIAGLLIVLVYSPSLGLLRWPINTANDWLHAHPDWQQRLHFDDVQIVFAFPGLFLATLLVTVPLVALEVLPSLEQLDPTEAQAARTLGATGWQTFWRVTLPAIRWSVLYGVVLCTAKAAGEFGAVSGVSGRLIGETNTLTLHIERSYAEWENTKAFASATLLTALSVGTLIVNLLLTRGHAKRSAS